MGGCQVSLQENWNKEIPTDTAKKGRELFAPENPYRLVGDGVNDVLSRKDFDRMYSKVGRGAVHPVVLSLVTVFQFLENIQDRVPAQWAVARMDWKYALHMPLDWKGFHYSDLCNFRKRLLEHGAERLIFDKVLEWVRSLGFLKKHGKQRSDSTHFLGAVERLSRLELVWETLRVALKAIEAEAAQWYGKQIPSAFHEVYVERQSSWRLSKQEVQAEMLKAGTDGFWLLDRLEESASKRVLELPEVETLRTVWKQQFEREGDETKTRPPSGRGKGKDLVVTPHDPEARWSEKRGKDWVGYRLQVTETAEDEVTQQFITDIDVVAANRDDSEVVEEIQERLTERGLKPQEQDVDQGYTSGPNLAHSAARGIELLGPVAQDTAGKPEGYKQSDFELDFEAQQATCPQGKIALAWYERPSEENDGYVGAEIQFRKECEGCPVRAECAPGKCGRTLKVSPYYLLLQQRRDEQGTEVFKERYKRRAAVEGTISEVVRAHGGRRARYRGHSKARLQALFIGAATNLKRLARALAAQNQQAKPSLVAV
jgi:transposase